MSKKRNFYNKGQEDRANGKDYNSPSTFLDWFDPSTSRLEKTDENAAAYKKGWEHNKSQS